MMKGEHKSEREDMKNEIQGNDDSCTGTEELWRML